MIENIAKAMLAQGISKISIDKLGRPISIEYTEPENNVTTVTDGFPKVCIDYQDPVNPVLSFPKNPFQLSEKSEYADIKDDPDLWPDGERPKLGK